MIPIIPHDLSHSSYFKEVNGMRDFFKENWLTIVLSAATTIVYRLLTGW